MSEKEIVTGFSPFDGHMEKILNPDYDKDDPESNPFKDNAREILDEEILSKGSSALNINFKLAPGCEDYAPVKANPDDACWDIFAAEEAIVSTSRNQYGCGSKSIKTGFHVDIPPGWEMVIRSRSGLGFKKNIQVHHGTIDAGYRGDVSVKMFNHGQNDFEVKPGDRIAQIAFRKLPEIHLNQVEEFEGDTARGDKGFGSSGGSATLS